MPFCLPSWLLCPREQLPTLAPRPPLTPPDSLPHATRVGEAQPADEHGRKRQGSEWEGATGVLVRSSSSTSFGISPFCSPFGRDPLQLNDLSDPHPGPDSPLTHVSDDRPKQKRWKEGKAGLTGRDSVDGGVERPSGVVDGLEEVVLVPVWEDGRERWERVRVLCPERVGGRHRRKKKLGFCWGESRRKEGQHWAELPARAKRGAAPIGGKWGEMGSEARSASAVSGICPCQLSPLFWSPPDHQPAGCPVRPANGTSTSCRRRSSTVSH